MPTTAYLNEAMSQLYHTMYGSDKKDKEENEAGLIAADDPVCYNCKKKEPKLFQRPLKREKGRCSGGKKGKCGLCKKTIM
eukprot:9395260-Ditylum_brightwellii.AAC.2